MLPYPTDSILPADLALPPSALTAPAPSRANPLGLPGLRPVTLAGAVPLPGLEPWTCFGRLA